MRVFIWSSDPLIEIDHQYHKSLKLLGSHYLFHIGAYSEVEYRPVQHSQC